MTGWGPFGLDGRRAAVTGGAMGIGFGIARRFLDAGADVLVADLDPQALEAAADRLAGSGGKVETLVLDVAVEDAGNQLVAAASAAFGGLDVLVNNAGIFPSVPLLEMEPALLDRVLDVNLRGLVLVSKAVGRHLVAAGTGGSILNIASIDALHPSMVGLAAYDASKGGVVMFTKSLALELAPHRVTVNAIAPGGIRTEGTTRPLDGSGMTAEEMQALTSHSRPCTSPHLPPPGSPGRSWWWTAGPCSPDGIGMQGGVRVDLDVREERRLESSSAMTSLPGVVSGC
jgi:2-deoxy-D-gluconate 3-dehydrogenase